MCARRRFGPADRGCGEQQRPLACAVAGRLACLGNFIKYTLDNIGNRTLEEVKDPLGVPSRQVSRGIDALGRIQQTTGRE
jgi:hypothetical protein